MNRVLTVCIGNICRSPLAQAALARELPGWQVSSAGLQALIGQPADALSQAVARDQGLDLTAHLAQQITQFLAQQAEVILVMESSHQQQLEALYPTVRGKVYRLGHYSRFDIADPYRQPREAFEAAWAAIATGVAEWAPRLKRLA